MADKLLYSFFDNSNECIFLFDSKQNLSSFNRAAKLFAQENFLIDIKEGISTFELFKNLSFPVLFEKNFRKAANGETVFFEQQFSSVPKLEETFLCKLSPVFDQNSLTIGVSLTITNTKDSKSNKHEIQYKQIQEIFDNSTKTFISVIDSDLNTEFYAGENFRGIIDNADDKIISSIFNEKIQYLENEYKKTFAGQERNFEINLGENYFLFQALPVYVDTQVKKIIVVIQDITRQKLSEKVIKEAEQRFKYVFEGSNVGFWDWNIKTGEVVRNKEWAEMLGYQHQDIVFTVKQWEDFLHPDDRAKALESINLHLKGETAAHKLEYRMLTKNGKYIWVLDQAKVLEKDQYGNPCRMSGTHLDITKLKDAEEELRKREALLQELVDTKDKFFSIISHDLRSPFNSILGLSGILLKKHSQYPPEKTEEILSKIHAVSQNTYNLLENLLTWARTQTGSIQIEPEIFDINSFIGSVVSEFEERYNQKQIQICYDQKIDVYVLADKNSIDLVLRNLLSNALKFTQRGGKVVVSHTFEQIDEQRYVNISVKDNGVGISPEKIDTVFLITGDNSKNGTESESGTGLGLILCREFIEKNKGKIWVESTLGKGSNFVFSLPLVIND